jgi:AcrR family transcriptional regulator
MPEGLRARKKQEARQRIADIATGLFVEYGFDHVTVAEIAAAAEVAKMTVFNYFPRKEDLLLDLEPEAEELLLQAIGNRPAGQPVTEAVRVLMHRLLTEGHDLAAAQPSMALIGRLVADSPALLSRAREQREQLQQAVTGQLTGETGDPVTADLVARLLLATMTTVVVTATRRLIAGEPADVVAADQPGLIDWAFGLLGAGIGKVGAAGPPPQ